MKYNNIPLNNQYLLTKSKTITCPLCNKKCKRLQQIEVSCFECKNCEFILSHANDIYLFDLAIIMNDRYQFQYNWMNDTFSFIDYSSDHNSQIDIDFVIDLTDLPNCKNKIENLIFFK